MHSSLKPFQNQEFCPFFSKPTPRIIIKVEVRPLVLGRLPLFGPRLCGQRLLSRRLFGTEMEQINVLDVVVCVRRYDADKERISGADANVANVPLGRSGMWNDHLFFNSAPIHLSCNNWHIHRELR